MIEAAIERARGQEQDQDTVWTDSSRLDSGGVGLGIAWYEEVPEEGPPGSVSVSRRGTYGGRKEGAKRTYLPGQTQVVWGSAVRVENGRLWLRRWS